jgi:predicted nucleic acid-binding Zn ribbon protein
VKFGILAALLGIMDRLIKTLPAILKASGASEEVAEAACVSAWKHAVGEGLSGHAVPVGLQQRTLVVAVADNVWKKQLEQMRGQLLFRLNSVLGQALVKSIEFRVDSKKLERLRATEANTSKGPDVNYKIPTELLNAAAGIEDADLRRAFLGAATSCVRRLEKSQT